MATIDITHPHTLSQADAKAKAEELAKGMKEKLGIDWKWDGDKIRFDAPSGAARGVTGQCSINASDVRIEIDLPFLMRAIKGTIEDKVKERLGKLLG